MNNMEFEKHIQKSIDSGTCEESPFEVLDNIEKDIHIMEFFDKVKNYEEKMAKVFGCPFVDE